MRAAVYNACLLVGWLGASAGACMLSLPGGLMFGGLLLIVLTVYSARLAAMAGAR